MRASRLLQMLLLLQNRGRLTARQLAEELECAPRTILRDVDAMTEAGLPIIVHQGNRGGIELGFNYRTRLTGLAADEAEALAVLLSTPNSAIPALGMDTAARRAIAKLVESFPDRTRAQIATAQSRFMADITDPDAPDPRIAAIAGAIRGRNAVTLRFRDSDAQRIVPESLNLTNNGWMLTPESGDPIPITLWGDINIATRPAA